MKPFSAIKCFSNVECLVLRSMVNEMNLLLLKLFHSTRRFRKTINKIQKAPNPRRNSLDMTILYFSHLEDNHTRIYNNIIPRSKNSL